MLAKLSHTYFSQLLIIELKSMYITLKHLENSTYADTMEDFEKENFINSLNQLIADFPEEQLSKNNLQNFLNNRPAYFEPHYEIPQHLRNILYLSEFSIELDNIDEVNLANYITASVNAQKQIHIVIDLESDLAMLATTIIPKANTKDVLYMMDATKSLIGAGYFDEKKEIKQAQVLIQTKDDLATFLSGKVYAKFKWIPEESKCTLVLDLDCVFNKANRTFHSDEKDKFNLINDDLLNIISKIYPDKIYG